MASVVQIYPNKDVLATAQVVPSGAGFASNWWLTQMISNVPYVIGHASIPVFGPTERLANQRMAIIHPDVIHFFENVQGGDGVPASAPPSMEHVYEHMDYHDKRFLTGTTKVQKTIAFYTLLSGFRVFNPAVVIGTYMGTPVRTIHDRIARARKDGQLPDYGRGRSHA